MAQEDTASSIADLVERLGRLVRSSGYVQGLNPAQWEALRYLGRCNGFSNNPSALASFLSATKGTVSQTVSSLERKGLLTKAPRAGQGRALSLILTAKGRAMLDSDPIADLKAAAVELGSNAAALDGQLKHLLAECQALYGVRTFGKCRTCRHFEKQIPEGAFDRCSLMGARIEATEVDRICAEHTPREMAGVR
ncbi:MarR family winged helix-turn-helix transcriptional regulator [Microbaculum sp. FT89]|uniref:MarR family winged helix-turn-helix transcriptional regulator n=1 Tax=Microbaculum sp. FT89 TaxID=3447298 RepID=UPI003F5297A0